MTFNQIITWHKNAVLVDKAGNQVDYVLARQNTPNINCDPTEPRNSLPEFFAAIAEGTPPIMGSFDKDRPKCIGDFLTQTGGTTGCPKIILRSSKSWMISFGYMADHFAIGTNARVAALGHLNHSLALYAALEALYIGAEFHALGGLSPSLSITELEKRRITHLYATPTQLQILRSSPLHDIAHVFVGGGALSSRNRIHIAKIFPNAQITQFYGAAETSFITLSDAKTPDGSVGKAFSNVEIEIRNKNRHPCKIGCIGRIWVKTPLGFKDYLPNKALVSKSNNTYICVDELGYLDHKGYLYISGRAERTVTIADQTVYLDQVEDRILQSNTIKHAAVFAVPHEIKGHILHAAICLENDVPENLFDCVKHLPNLVRPRKLKAILNWPLLPSGKTDYKRLERLIK